MPQAAAIPTQPTASGLAGVRAGQLSDKGEQLILPERISKEPLGPMVRHGDDQWFDLVRFVTRWA